MFFFFNPFFLFRRLQITGFFFKGLSRHLLEECLEVVKHGLTARPLAHAVSVERVTVVRVRVLL